MKFFVAAVLLLTCCVAMGQTQSAPASVPSENISGTYSFLSDGEFVQIDMEDDGRVTGFISRYGDSNSDKGAFLDHLIKQGELKGKKLHFVTRTVHGVWYEFTGTAEADDSKNPYAEGHRVLKGKLRVNTEGEKTTSKSRDVTFKSMPTEDVVRK